MRNPDVILSCLAEQSNKNSNYKHQKLYKLLLNKEFYLTAYGEIYAKPGNMTEGVDKVTIDGMSMNRIDKIINNLKDESYKPNPVRRQYIPKKNSDKMRPLGIPSFDDKLIQKVMEMILSSIYEPIFKDTSHGFRSKRSCHTALERTKIHFQGSAWFIEGDIKGFFDNINHNILIQLLSKRINDDRFLRLVRKFLGAGYMENWKFHNTYSGTPQGGIISPVLANIYLHELDEFMENMKEKFDRGKWRKRNNEYRNIEARIRTARLKIKEIDSSENPEQMAEVRKALVAKLAKESKLLLKTPNRVADDPDYRRIQYVRYADDFLIGVIGNKEEAENIKADIHRFLEKQLELELSIEKTLITNTQKPAKFLGYEIFVHRDSSINKVKGSNGKIVKKRTNNGIVMLKMPMSKVRDKLLEWKTMRLVVNDKGVEIWKPKSRNSGLNLTPLENIVQFNGEIRGFYQYYKLAHNVSELHKMSYIMKYSLAKTLAMKHKSTARKMFRKYSKDGTFGVYYKTLKGEKFMTFYDNGFKTQKASNNNKVDDIPNFVRFKDRTKLEQRLLAGECEYCGDTKSQIEVHHIRKIKDLKGKKKWEQNMIARKRKTMCLCVSCHDKLHAGKLD
ncbi:reverse transcriptase domain-containing protein [Bacillus pacificus]|uniref:reverse transcriptase domain-containing protein n=1 Tax=Bacillus pacificus TaxID=2026187 RepID=UPI0021D398B8|nr:reverse transcriptase domain-containing protein [Bacillus pacificus]MCU5375517.1 reverse transcriptase domain-containing protein [Bacillus pacificus]